MNVRSEAAGSALEAIVLPGMSTSPLSSAVVNGHLIFTSGQTGRKPGAASVPEAFEDQVELAIENLDRVLGEAGGSLDTIIRTTVYLVDAADFKSMNTIYAAHFAAPHPARSTLVVAALALPELKFEIEAVAIRHPRATEHRR